MREYRKTTIIPPNIKMSQSEIKLRKDNEELLHRLEQMESNILQRFIQKLCDIFR